MTTYPISSDKSLSPNRKTAVSFTWVDWVLVLVTAVLALILYGRTLTPGLLTGDGGEFQTLATLLGHTHPTGYPVYLALAKLLTFLPVGDVAYRVNLFSAVMGALAVGSVYLIGRLLTNYRAIPFAGALALAVSPTFWSQAVIAEVYTAGSAFLVFILLALLWWDRSGSAKALFAAGLMGGLSLGVHMSVALLAPTAILFVVATSVTQKTAKAVSTNLKTAVLGALTGVTITIILFLLIDWHNPAANYFNSVIEPSRSAWGLAAEDVDGPLERLIFGWSARQFRPFMFANMRDVMPQQAADYGHNLPAELGWPLIVLAAVGAVYLLMQQWRTAVLLLLTLFTQLFYFFNYEIWDLYVFYIPSYVILVLLAVAGMGGAADAGRKLLQREKSGWLPDAVIATAVFLFAIYPVFQPQQEAVVAGTVPFAFDEYPVYSESLLPIARATVLDLPDNSIVFTDWDMMWPYYYAAAVENGRTDLTFIETYPADDQDGVAASVLEYVAGHIADQPIYFTERESALQEAGYQFSPARMGPTRLVKIREE